MTSVRADERNVRVLNMGPSADTEAAERHA
jgi:hypothetical protein